MDHIEPIPSDVHKLVEVFEGELNEVAFPDVDYQRLAASIEAVQSGAKAVEEATDALVAARSTYEANRQELMQRAVRGLAYAKVFAADDSALTGRLEQLAIGTAPPAKTEKRRGRPRKRKAPPKPAEVSTLPLPEDGQVGAA